MPATRAGLAAAQEQSIKEMVESDCYYLRLGFDVRTRNGFVQEDQGIKNNFKEMDGLIKKK